MFLRDADDPPPVDRRHDPKHVAEVQAEFMAGTMMPFPPNPAAFSPCKRRARHRRRSISRRQRVAAGRRRRCRVHPPRCAVGRLPTRFALSVAADAARIEAIARRDGWPCFVCSRGAFGVVAVWIEGETMVELLPPAFARRYLDMAPALAAAPAARSSAHPTDADGVRDTGLFLCVG
jgi:hypothetical protein